MLKSKPKLVLVQSLLLTGLCLSSVADADQNERYEYRKPLKGLVAPPATSNPDPDDGDTEIVPPEPEPVEPEITWTLNTASLPTAATGSVYSYSFYNRISPAGVTGFSWSGQGLPSWATLNPSTGVMTGTPSASDVGSKSFSVTASREGTSSQKAYSVNVETPCIRASQAANNLVGTNFCNYEGVSMYHSENGYLFKNETNAAIGYQKAPAACTAKGPYRIASAEETFSYMRKKGISYAGYWVSGTRYVYRVGTAEYNKSAQSNANYTYLCMGTNAN